METKSSETSLHNFKKNVKLQPQPHLNKTHAPDPKEISVSYQAANRAPRLKPKNFVGYCGR
eukprot:6557318-Ditylum_brightwellii.AAC.1